MKIIFYLAKGLSLLMSLGFYLIVARNPCVFINSNSWRQLYIMGFASGCTLVMACTMKYKKPAQPTELKHKYLIFSVVAVSTLVFCYVAFHAGFHKLGIG